MAERETGHDDGSNLLRDQFGAAPVAQRGPDTAIEAEAVDRRGTVDGADAVKSDTAPLEAALLQHAPRRGIADARAGLQLLAAQHAEGVIDHRTRGFGGIAAAPEFGAEPV